MPGLSDESSFTFSVEAKGETARLVLQGELDVSHEEELRSTLSEVQSGAECVELDLSGLTFIDSSGIRMLLRAATHPSRPSGRVVMTAVSEPVKRTMDALGLLEFFEHSGRNGA